MVTAIDSSCNEGELTLKKGMTSKRIIILGILIGILGALSILTVPSIGWFIPIILVIIFAYRFSRNFKRGALLGLVTGIFAPLFSLLGQIMFGIRTHMIVIEYAMISMGIIYAVLGGIGGYIGRKKRPLETIEIEKDYRICPRCSKEVRPDFTICPSCGEILEEES